MVVIGQKFLYSGKVVVLGQSCCILGKSCCIRAKVVEFGHKWFYTSRVVVWEQSGSTRAKVVLFGQSDCIREK